MSGSTALTPINSFSAKNAEIIHLQELDIVAGRLETITEVENAALVCVDGFTVELPPAFSGPMQEMLGQKIWLAKVEGQIRAGVMTA